MKRLILLLLTLCLTLCACGGTPAQTTVPGDTTVPAETTLPPETTVPMETSGAPIRAEYAEETFNPYHVYWCEESDYITSIGFTAAETLTDVHFTELQWEEEGYTVAQELYTIETLEPDQPFLAQVTFWGDMTTYGISFTDASGEVRHYAILVSGKDGSLLCNEYEGG